MRFGSVCSGIEAASVAWEPLGWSAAWFSEIEPFPCALLKHKYPTVPNHGDMTTLPARIRAGEVEAPNLFCGGTPCQAFSVVGLRQSLADDRGNLSLVFCEVANAIDAVRSARGERPAIIFWENVPGVLSTPDNAFGCFLAGLAGETVPLEPAGRKWTDAGVVLGPTRAVAWRVLDAQYFGVAQRRKRVFVVASARDDFDCAAVLFERENVRRDFAPSRKTEQGFANKIDDLSTIGSLCARSGQSLSVQEASSGFIIPDKLWPAEIAPTLDATYGSKYGLDNQNINGGGGLFVAAHAFHACATDIMQYGDVSGTLDTDGQTIGVVFDTTQITSRTNRSNPQPGDPCHTLAKGAEPPTLATPYAVRRLTPRECERLQGFPDNYTAIPYKNKPAADCPDGPRYKALGNSWAVPVVRWIGNRIQQSTR